MIACYGWLLFHAAYFEMKHGDLSPSCFLQMEESTFKAASFSKSASARQLSLQERKEAMLEAARKRYREKHGVP